MHFREFSECKRLILFCRFRWIIHVEGAPGKWILLHFMTTFEKFLMWSAPYLERDEFWSVRSKKYIAAQVKVEHVIDWHK